MAEIREAAAAHRENLFAHGVVYPGTDIDHSAATSTLIGRRSPAWRATRTLAAWDALRTEVEAHPRSRALISDEHMAACDDDTARRFADELRGSLHVVITARNLGSILPSIWQQNLENGQTATYAKWLAQVLDTDRPKGGTGSRLPDEYDLAEQVVRWTRLIGPAHVHVVLVDDDDPTVVSNAFETMLGLPAGMLAHAEPTDREMAGPLRTFEANALRRLNTELKRAGGGSAAGRAVRAGVIAALPSRRQPSEGEGRLGVPPKYAGQLASQARRLLDAAVANGIEVVGADGRFQAPPPAPSSSRPSPEERVEVITSMLRGAVSTALGRGVDFEVAAPEPHPLGQEASAPRRGRARDVLHVDLSSRRVIDGIQPASPGDGRPSLIGGVARVVATSRTARWVGIEGYAIVDPRLRERVFGALNDPKVVITVDAGAERALWEQALALGETRGFSDWSFNGDALLDAISEEAEDVAIIRSDDDDAIRRAIQEHPAPLQWTARPNRLLKGPDIQIIHELNESLADVDLQPFERLAAIGDGAMGGMRTRRSRSTNRPDSMARAIAGIVSIMPEIAGGSQHAP